jgi:predicted class III extradiol MEMO1 family dioxygenase
MHLPYVRKIFAGYEMFFWYSRVLVTPGNRQDIAIVPIVVGAISQRLEAMFGSLLAPYLARDDTLCVVSSDFCHWLGAYTFLLLRFSLIHTHLGDQDFHIRIIIPSPHPAILQQFL